VKAFSRPYPIATVGIPIDIQFDIAKAEFRLVVRVRAEDSPVAFRSAARTRPGTPSSTAYSANDDPKVEPPPTEIFLPVVHFAADRTVGPLMYKSNHRRKRPRWTLTRSPPVHAPARRWAGYAPVPYPPRALAEWPCGGCVCVRWSVGARWDDAAMVVPRAAAGRAGSRVYDRRRTAWRPYSDEAGAVVSRAFGSDYVGVRATAVSCECAVLSNDHFLATLHDLHPCLPFSYDFFCCSAYPFPLSRHSRFLDCTLCVFTSNAFCIVHIVSEWGGFGRFRLYLVS
jgi:hypothetical protein